MKISLKEAGGWGANLPPVESTVDLEQMDAESAREGRTLLAKLLQSSPADRDASHDRDALEYTVWVDDQGSSTVVSSTSAGLSREFAEFLNWFKRQA